MTSDSREPWGVDRLIHELDRYAHPAAEEAVHTLREQRQEIEEWREKWEDICLVANDLRGEIAALKRERDNVVNHNRILNADNAALRARCDEMRNGWLAYKHHYEHWGGGDIRTGRAWDAMNRAALQGKL